MKYREHIKEMMNRHQAPFYFYDLDGFEDHLREIKKITEAGIKVWYATKANPLSEVLRILKLNGFGVDVASYGELRQARDAGLEKENIMASGIAKNKNYLASLMQAEVKTIVIESINQLTDLNAVAARLERKQDVLLRIQIERTNITPFGLTSDDWKQFDISDFKNLNVIGVQCSEGKNILSLSQLEEMWIRIINEAQNLFWHLGLDLEVLDLGSSVGIPYKANDPDLSYREIHALLVDIKRQFEIKEIWLELGRFCVGKFGSYFTKVADKKSIRGKDLLITEGGSNHLGRLDISIDSFPCDIFNKQSRNIRSYTIHGPLCTDVDLLGTHELSDDIDVNDWLEFKHTGAYGFTGSIPYFDCQGMVGEAFLHKGELVVPRAPTSNIEWMI